MKNASGAMPSFVLGAGAVVVGILTASAASDVRDPKLQRERLRIISTGIAGAALLLWPLLWLSLGLNTSKSPLVRLAFLWPLVLIGVDLLYAGTRSRGTPAEEADKAREMRMIGDRLIGAVWSLGALLIVLRTHKKMTPQSGFSTLSAKVLMASLLFVLMFVLPTSDAPRELDRIAVYQAQRCALHYACGLFAAGILVVVGNPKAT